MSELIRWQDKDLTEYYEADEVDAVIAELKAELDKTIAERDGNQVCIDALNAKLDDAKATAYTDSVDAGMRERRLKRALYKACANWANLEVFDRTVGINDPNTEANRWALMRNKCIKKMEEYK